MTGGGADFWNGARYEPGARRGHVESYFLKLNDPAAPRALWLKATILARPGEPAMAEAWAISFDTRRGHRAARERAPLGAGASFSRDRLDVKVARLVLRDGETSGEVASGGVRVRWALRYRTREAPLVPFPAAWMYSGPFPRSKLVSPVPDADFEGEYEVDGVLTPVVGWRGMQGHNWGGAHAHRYAWGHCNGFASERELVFEGLTGRVKAGPFVSPKVTLLCVRHRGVRYEWTRLSEIARARGAMDTRAWAFAADSDLGSIEGEMRAGREDFVGLTYENPRGPPTHCLNSKLAHLTLRFAPAGRPALRLESTSAALELGTTDPSHGVRMHI